MIAYKYVLDNKDGTYASPIVRDFLWRFGEWRHAVKSDSLLLGTTRYPGTAHGIHCLAWPMSMPPYIPRSDWLRLAVVEGVPKFSSLSVMTKARIVGWFTGNME